MAVVLKSDESSIFSSNALHRSHSQPKFVSQSGSYTKLSKSKSTVGLGNLISPSSSPTSSAESSPRTLHADSTAPSFSSTPASSLSLDAPQEDDDKDDSIAFPSYDDVGFFEPAEDLEPPLSPQHSDSYTVSPTSNSTSTTASRPISPDPVEHAEDDSAVRSQPSRHVDYLSHNWKEEDIWSSWKLIVSKRKAYNNSARLENASWRTWAKSKNRLKTVSPETLNWLKDCDVTWLYGPLQTGADKSLRMPSTSPTGSSRISKSNSFLNKKPILKKRSMSEIMLQRSLSSSSLLKQAAAALQAQQSDGYDRGLERSGFASMNFSSRRLSDHPSLLSSITSSGLQSPGTDRKHIHFNEQVEQCIAVEVKGADDEPEPSMMDYDDSDSDDGGIMMKRTDSGRRLPPLYRSSTPRPINNDSKTIAMLPSTTLKYMEDSESHDTAVKHSNGFWNGRRLSPSPSQETLRPSKPSSRILVGDDEEDDADVDWQPSSVFVRNRDDHATTQERLQILRTSESSELAGEPSGMRRTPSGMFMPEGEEGVAISEGLFGKVVDTVNTAKDIAHVIWNVGWRR